MQAAQYEMVRYADDAVILCRNPEETERALQLLAQLLAQRRLKLHPQKTRIANLLVPGESFEFLGYRFEGTTRWPKDKSLNKLKDSIRHHTPRLNGKSMPAIIESLNQTLKGWFQYFKHSTHKIFRPIDGFVRRRLRSILRKRSHRKGVCRGGIDHQRWLNRYFQALGLFFLEDAHAASLQSSTR